MPLTRPLYSYPVLQVQAWLCSGTMPMGESGGCLGSTSSGEAAMCGQLSATLSLHVLCFQLLGMLPCLADQDGAVLCRWVCLQAAICCSWLQTSCP